MGKILLLVKRLMSLPWVVVHVLMKITVRQMLTPFDRIQNGYLKYALVALIMRVNNTVVAVHHG